MQLHLALSAAALLLASLALATPPAYMEYDPAIFGEYVDYDMGRIFQNAEKRGCVSRGGNCDHRPNDCCYSTNCRCNLWGANCRCQRKGLFSKLG